MKITVEFILENKVDYKKFNTYKDLLLFLDNHKDIKNYFIK